MSKNNNIGRVIVVILLVVFTITSISHFSLRHKLDSYPDIPESVDVVIIGSGLAGAAAALSSTQAGAQVLYIDMTSDGLDFPAFSPAFWAAGTVYQEQLDFDYSPLEMTERITGGDEEQSFSLVLRLSQESAASLAWLEESTGRDFSLLPDSANPGLHWPLTERAEDFTVEGLHREFSFLLHGISRQAIPEQLLVEDGKVKGVILKDHSGTEYTVRCRTVLLADGGIAGNPELFESHTGLDAVTPRPQGGHKGLGLSLAKKIGTDIEKLSHVNLISVYLPDSRLFSASTFSTAVYLHPDGSAITLDPTPVEAIHSVGGLVYSVLGRGHEGSNGNFLPFENMESLAEVLDMDLALLSESLGRLNPPYLVGALGVIALTPGGLRIDEHFRVLRDDGSFIEGLYAAGEIVSGLYGDEANTDWVFAADVTSGRLAGHEAARQAQW